MRVSACSDACPLAAAGSWPLTALRCQPAGALASVLTKKANSSQFDHCGIIVMRAGTPHVLEHTYSGIKVLCPRVHRHHCFSRSYVACLISCGRTNSESCGRNRTRSSSGQPICWYGVFVCPGVSRSSPWLLLGRQPSPEQVRDLTTYIKTHKFVSGDSWLTTIARSILALAGVSEPPVPAASAALAVRVYQMLGAVPKSVDTTSVAVPVRAPKTCCRLGWLHLKAMHCVCSPRVTGSCPRNGVAIHAQQRHKPQGRQD